MKDKFTQILENYDSINEQRIELKLSKYNLKKRFINDDFYVNVLDTKFLINPDYDCLYIQVSEIPKGRTEFVTIDIMISILEDFKNSNSIYWEKLETIRLNFPDGVDMNNNMEKWKQPLYEAEKLGLTYIENEYNNIDHTVIFLTQKGFNNYKKQENNNIFKDMIMNEIKKLMNEKVLEFNKAPIDNGSYETGIVIKNPETNSKVIL